ncbi:MAG TPA: hypothetical protein VGJ92_08960 [Methanocella sp.]|jgi:hypothetical protein
MITTTGRNLLRDSLTGSNAIMTYLAWGNGTSDPTPGQTRLDNEIGRLQITSYSPIANGTEKIITKIPAEQGNTSIKELALFGGPGATSARDSGVMLARVLYSRTKTNLESWQVDVTTIFDVI